MKEQSLTITLPAREEEEMALREKMIARIEGYFGCYGGVWYEWDTKEIEKLDEFITENPWQLLPSNKVAQ